MIPEWFTARARDLFATAGARRRLGTTLVYFVPLALVIAVAYRDLYHGSTRPAVTSHEVLSMNVALNARFCGTSGRLSSRFAPYDSLAAHREMMGRPLADVITANAGSVDAYCRTVTEPYMLAENSVMWLARAVMRLRPNTSADTIGNAFGALRLSMVLAFALALIWGGGSVAFAAAASFVGAEILRGLGIRETPYPFQMTLPLLVAAVCGIAALFDGVASRWRMAALGLAMGAVAAFGGGLRTILLPAIAAMFATFVVVTLAADSARHRSARITIAALAAAAFVAGYVAYVETFVAPLRVRANPAVSDYAYHTFAHPLVLGLAVPESPFTQREGIKWNDELGVTLARQIRPDVDLLGPGYERALLAYYARLWKRHPGEMARVYLYKLRWTGVGVFESVADVGAQFGIPSGPAEWLNRVTSGVAIVAFSLMTVAFATRRYLCSRRVDALIITLVGVAALGALAEAFVTYSIYVSAYYNELLYFMFLAMLFWIQAAVDAVVAVGARSRQAAAAPGFAS